MKTPPPESVPYEKFEIEMNAKNMAYAFILSHCNFDEWVEFNRTYKSNNPHNECINQLKLKVLED